ncbi:MAG: iron-sulfur cluster assembly scaffold protein [bacterium]
MDIYREDILDHYENPRNMGELTDDLSASSGQVLEGRDSNASCGDMIQFQLKIVEGKIDEVKWKGIGCAISTAAASKLSEWLLGQTLKTLEKMDEEEIIEQGVGLEVNPGRMKCLTLPVRVVRKIINQ